MAKVIVTGAGGFVGRHLVRLLIDRGDEVTATDAETGAIPPDARVIAGDICRPDHLDRLFSAPSDAVIHLATIPGGGAEADPQAARRVNVDAMYDILERAAAWGTRPRFVYASSIAVLGETMPAGGVTDATPLSPHLLYGGQKAMMEPMVATLSNRGAIDGVTIRLPGILARPLGAKGVKSAFLSELFHALKKRESFTCPTSPDATIWAQSVIRCARNFVHALDCDSGLLPPTRAVTLPALRIEMGELAAEIARQCGVSPTLVTWRKDEELQAIFGAYPPLETPAAERAGFSGDAELGELVSNALEALG